MAETEKKIEAIEAQVEKEVVEATANPQADAPKKNAVAAEPTHLKNDAEDLGAAVVKPTDSNPDATKKISQVSGDPQQKAQGSADAMPKLKEEDETDKADEKKSEVKEGEMPKAALDALKKSQDKKEMSHEDEKKKDMKEESEDELIDVSADVEALTKDEDLSEDFKAKAATIFEAAVNSKVKEAKMKLKAGYEEKLKEEVDTAKAELVEKVDSYLNYVVEEWMQENTIAVEQGIKTQIAENFICGLKNLFENHYIDVPNEKYNALDELYSHNIELSKTLNTAITENINLRKEVALTECAGIFVAETRDLADTQVAKLQSLMENVAFSDINEYREKLVAIKENYLNNQTYVPQSRPAMQPINEEMTFSSVKEVVPTAVNDYVSAIAKLNKKL